MERIRDKDAMKTNSFNVNNLIRPNVLAMQAYRSARTEFTGQNTDMIFLDANENPFKTNVNRYPDPRQESLKSLVASQKGISENQILAGNGSDEVLDLLFRAFCRPAKDNVITCPPTYGMYKVLSAINDVTNIEVALLENFQLDIPSILKAIHEHTKLLFICSPNNPTGNSISATAIKILLESFNGLVVIDEAYIDFASATSWVQQIENYPNLVVIQTLSKAYGMAGIRLGFAFAASNIISVLNKIKPPYNVNTLTQQKAYECLKDNRAIQNEIDSIISQRKLLLDAFNEIDSIKEVFPSQANFILCRVDNAGKRYTQLLEQGIVVRNRSKQYLCENTLRFTIGTPTENRQLVTVLKSLT